MALRKTVHQALLLGIGWGFYGVAVLACAARFYVRFIMIRIPGAYVYPLIGMLVSTHSRKHAYTFAHPTNGDIGRGYWYAHPAHIPYADIVILPRIRIWSLEYGFGALNLLEANAQLRRGWHTQGSVLERIGFNTITSENDHERDTEQESRENRDPRFICSQWSVCIPLNILFSTSPWCPVASIT